MTEDRGPWLSTATALFFSWALLSLCVRIWVKLGRKQKWTHSETAVSAAFVVVLLHVATNFWAIHRGYGRPLADIEESQLPDVQGALFASQISYIVSVGLTRISTAFFISQLTRHRPQLRMSYVLAGASGVWTVASTLVVSLRGDMSRPWATLDGTQILYVQWIAVEATGLALETALWVMSAALIWGLQMKLQKRAQILGAFGFRLLLIPIVAIRLFYLAPAQNSNPTFTSILPHILTEAAVEYALMATSITALKPFLQPFHTGAIVNSIGGAGSGIYSGSRSRTQGIYMLSSTSGKEHDDTGRTTVTVESGHHNEAAHSQHPLRIDSTKGWPNTEVDRDDIGSMESAGSARMIIKTTKEWSLRYENR